MQVFKKSKEILQFLSKEKSLGKQIGFVPTMGALHDGHISLIQKSLIENDVSVCSIFVNPAQFNDKKDLANYPRSLKKDFSKLIKAHCTAVFVPSNKEVYPDKNEIFRMNFGNLEKVMEGKFRPGHFNGMAGVVDKLFRIVVPHRAYFGEKDFQQMAIITELAKRKHPSVKIVPCATIREKDGLAMSSRNKLLSVKERKAAAILSKTLFEVREKSGKIPVALLKNWAVKFLSSTQLVKMEYFEIIDSITLKPIKEWKKAKKIRACVAAKVGKVRLIDNIEL
jgi:pantoate--beta-alanine ligase